MPKQCFKGKILFFSLRFHMDTRQKHLYEMRGILVHSWAHRLLLVQYYSPVHGCNMAHTRGLNYMAQPLF